MTLDSRVAAGRVEAMVGQGVQPIPHDMEVCDERSEESSCWQAERTAARGFTLATKAAGASGPGGQSRSAATAAASDADTSNVDCDGSSSSAPASDERMPGLFISARDDQPPGPQPGMLKLSAARARSGLGTGTGRYRPPSDTPTRAAMNAHMSVSSATDSVADS